MAYLPIRISPWLKNPDSTSPDNAYSRFHIIRGGIVISQEDGPEPIGPILKTYLELQKTYRGASQAERMKILRRADALFSNFVGTSASQNDLHCSNQIILGFFNGLLSIDDLRTAFTELSKKMIERHDLFLWATENTTTGALASV